MTADLDTAQAALELALEGGAAAALRAMTDAMDQRGRAPWWRPLRRRALDWRIEAWFALAGAFTAEARTQREASARTGARR